VPEITCLFWVAVFSPCKAQGGRIAGLRNRRVTQQGGKKGSQNGYVISGTFLSVKEKSQFPPLIPDFVIEVRSNSDRFSQLKRKMTDTCWMANGVRLAWLIEPESERSFIYRQGQATEEIKGFERILSGEDVCQGFELSLSWQRRYAVIRDD
jgi:Uma2 family endonuclease